MSRDPKCNHREATVRVSSHVNIAEAAASEATASTWCCDRPACRRDAEAWVTEITGKPPVTVPLRRRAS